MMEKLSKDWLKICMEAILELLEVGLGLISVRVELLSLTCILPFWLRKSQLIPKSFHACITFIEALPGLLFKTGELNND